MFENDLTFRARPKDVNQLYFLICSLNYISYIAHMMSRWLGAHRYIHTDIFTDQHAYAEISVLRFCLCDSYLSQS